MKFVLLFAFVTLIALMWRLTSPASRRNTMTFLRLIAWPVVIALLAVAAAIALSLNTNLKVI